MLTGRESLVRLIGRRRRFLPNCQSLLSSPIQSSLNLCTDKNGEIFSAITDDSKASNVVKCPICGNNVSANDNIINTHLDACLSRGTKRKLTQCTLLQLNFCTQSKGPMYSNVTERQTTNVVTEDPAKSLVPNAICGLENTVAVEKDDNNHAVSPLRFECMEHTSKAGLTENQINHQKIDCQDELPSSSPDTEVPKPDIDFTFDGISGATLQTFIVGRRFSNEKEISLETSISLLRDPQNPKDPYAIKVLCADSGSCKVLGYLPQELSQYLSPLIEKSCLTFEGYVTSAPKHSHDVVPIKITCHKLVSDCEIDDDIEVFKCLWKKALHVVDSAKNYPSSMIKYQHNFNLLVQEVLRSNPHLFTDDERVFLESFSTLSADGQRLFIRLYTRKGPWFRLSNISYREVLDSQEAVKELLANGYICSFGDKNELHDDMKEICNLLTVSELREILSVLKKNCVRGSRKQDLAMFLLRSYEDGSCTLLPDMILDRTGFCIRISSKAESLIWRAERLFFLNGEQDLSAFLLVDLGIVKYPAYNCIISEQIYSSLSDLLAYEEAIELAQIMDQSLDENNVELVSRCIMIADSFMPSTYSETIQSTTSELASTFHSRFSASWVYSKVVLLGISFLEREHRYHDAVNLLKRLLCNFPCDGRRGYWTLRLSVDLEHLGCPNESLLVAEAGLLDPWVRAGSKMALQRRVLRLGKPPRRWKTPSFSESIKRKIIEGRPLNCEMGMKSRFYGEDGEQCGVEQLALQYYAGEGGGWEGVHTESGIWLTIFGLLMWDIVFSDVPDVFRTKFQNAPLDLDTDSFYPVRKNLIESQLQKVHDGMAEEILITSWESHVGTACRGVNWDRHSLSELRAAVTCIGGPCLASLCRHLAQDYQSWSSGMPDLLLWRFHGEYRGEAKLVEVKGPRDKLSEQQRAWLLVLMDSGFKVEVCKVSTTPKSSLL
ncbi:fanconi-associated nuclease 1 homolog isoform X2 [Mangifera indica]|uniref:fanconi-associated nuclease 1 homolog isoform X2 n=1 Tax=Mangifera indica TaxID=29780 RepID=UPI001CFB1A49|nr:fanconi-associated nuclease 1 homolog isoform X2 [Mangifera indica]